MTTGSSLWIAVPPGFELGETVCSYGYFLLAPNYWRPEIHALERRMSGGEIGRTMPSPAATGSVGLVVTQPGGVGARLVIRCDRPLIGPERAGVKGSLSRMLRIDQDLSAWHRLSPAARRRRFGRLFRSPTLFEDMVKTITSCNVAWPSTVKMNRLLVERVGRGVFPSAKCLASLTPERLRELCRVGYRAKRIVSLARMFTSGELDPAWFEAPQRTTEELAAEVRRIDGFGPYSTANVLQLLGHYDRLPIDTETVRLFCKTTGSRRPARDQDLYPAIEAHYERYGLWRFLAYWFDVWRDYESLQGRATTWDAAVVATRFTASKLQSEPAG
ncbi:hypothetical protein [Botrimarina hoheduenensis]|uniref:DNA-(apurinic or apyrimidinic site) lyase n=1 Tax=Botrimarina hoheduenensis TaxID=2528000 RepID=A0A5C5VXT1_9BACT|nr:hypothetical protein [Botrimarina hoheduenensis]TWT42947.1 HhH-GPD superfamily base excision DNA repair protein [Botrimarina hoheduenensis]